MSEMNVLIYLETKEGKVGNSSLELITAGSELGTVNAVLIGENLQNAAQEAASYGVPVTYINQSVSTQDETVAVLEAEMRENTYDAALFAATQDGKDLAPRLAARFGSCSVTDVIRISDGTLTRPAYGGTILENMVFAEGKKLFATVRSGSFPKPETKSSAEVLKKRVQIPEKKILTTFIEKTIDITEKVDLEGAEIVVAGGRGCKDEETFGLVKELAELLGAELGASRPIIEAGWVSRARQVGQSGKVIAPRIYIACGISGAMQHISGVTSSDYIIAVNKDADAPIFEIADLGIVGRCEKILPLMIEAIRSR